MSGPSALHRYPVLVLTGGLGSGKTTLLSAWLGQAALRRAALVINEIGATGFDDQLLRPMMSASDSPTLIANACVCCTGLPDLGAALAELFRARLEHRIAPFDRIVVETTGLATPQPLRAAFAADPALRERFVLEGIETTVSATTAPDFDHDPADPCIEPCIEPRIDPRSELRTEPRAELRSELRAQIINADLLIITKTDRAAAHACDMLARRLWSLNPAATIHHSALADLPVQQVLDALGARAQRATAPIPHHAAPPTASQLTHETGNTSQPAAPSRSDHSHHGHHGHHDHDASARFVSLPEPVPRARLAQCVNRAIASAAGRLLRLKGIVCATDGGLVAVQWAPGDATASLAPFTGDAPTPMPTLGLQWIATDVATLDQLATASSALAPVANATDSP